MRRPARRGSLFVVLLLLASVGAASAAGSLSGDVFVTMQSGQVRRAADVDVVLVPATAQFEAEWERAQLEYEDRVKPVVSEHDAMRAQEEALRRNSAAATQSRDLKSALQFTNESIALSGRMLDLGRQKWSPLQQEYTGKLLDLIRQHAAARVATDVNGHFDLVAPEGKYYVFCRYTLPRETLYWFMPAEIAGSAAKVSLSNRSALRSPLRGKTWTSF